MSFINDAETSAFSRLRGEVLNIPDLNPIYMRWKSGQNPLRERLQLFVDENIDKYVLDAKARTKAKKSQLAWFVLMIYPEASWDQLTTIALLSITAFVFDDTIDKEIDPSNPDYASDFEAATSLRNHCIASVRYHLGLHDEYNGRQDETPLCPQEFSCFPSLASAVLHAPLGQIDVARLALDFEDFIESNAAEQQYRLSGTIPTVREYWRYRHGVGAVFMYCTFHQYVVNAELPEPLAQCDEVRVMRLETSAQPIICNDLYSLKKEMNDATPSNLVPIMAHHNHQSLESVVDQLIGQMYDSANNFDVAVASLREKGRAYDKATQDQLEKFIEAFETFQTGCFRYFMGSVRFRIQHYQQEDGSFSIPL
ncbi:terpenoid synthase [Xylariaceae sp. FL0016]|nr:terpenoid synthase [Xylariaceae sp. FL0016]